MTTEKITVNKKGKIVARALENAFQTMTESIEYNDNYSKSTKVWTNKATNEVSTLEEVITHDKYANIIHRYTKTKFTSIDETSEYSYDGKRLLRSIVDDTAVGKKDRSVVTIYTYNDDDTLKNKVIKVNGVVKVDRTYNYFKSNDPTHNMCISVNAVSGEIEISNQGKDNFIRHSIRILDSKIISEFTREQKVTSSGEIWVEKEIFTEFDKTTVVTNISDMTGHLLSHSVVSKDIDEVKVGDESTIPENLLTQEYDSNGNMISMVKIVKGADETLETTIEANTYDNNNNLISITVNGVPTYAAEYIYEK